MDSGIRYLTDLQADLISLLVKELEILERKLEAARGWDNQCQRFIEGLIKRLVPSTQFEEGGHTIDRLLVLEAELRPLFKLWEERKRQDAN